jgi:UDP-N-acetylglucosamine 2-epimerase (non-hydrolysing)
LKKVLVIFGTRPEAIKLAPVVAELRKHPGEIEPVVCVTAQHREMLDQVLVIFGIRPDLDLDLMEENQKLAAFSSQAMMKVAGAMEEVRPDVVLVQGDTTTAMISALCAFYEKIPVAHVEAGLRTYDIERPYPEEANRRIISHLGSYHFAPTENAAERLKQEGVAEGRIHVTGNTVIDALFAAVSRLGGDEEVDSRKNGRLSQNSQKAILVTAHRRESFGQPLREICCALKDIVERNREVSIVYPVHLNPNVKDAVFGQIAETERIRLLPPVDYLELCRLLRDSHLVLTDSGGIQEEAPSLGKPVLVMRSVTERPEAVEAGAAKLVGTDRQGIVSAVERLLSDDEEYRRMSLVKNPFGDGHAAERIVNILRDRSYNPFCSSMG